MKEINVYELARREEEIEGSLSIDELPNYHTYLCDGAKRIRYRMKGRKKVMNLPGADVRIWVKATVPCPHCLEAVPFEDHIEVTFAFVPTVQESLEMPIDEDRPGVEVVVASTHEKIATLIEEELILSVPYLSHDDCEQRAQDRSDEQEERVQEEKQNPFANLAELMKKAS